MSQSPVVVIRRIVSQSFEANRGALMAVGRVGQIETKTFLFSFPDRSQVCNTVLALLDTGSKICNKRRCGFPYCEEFKIIAIITFLILC